LPFKTGDTIEVTESKARQYFIHGIAIPYHKDIVEQGLVEALVEEKPTKEPIKAVKEVKKVAKKPAKKGK